MDKHLNNLLDNHYKLLSMISQQDVPIKRVLLNDVVEIKKVLEVSSKNKFKQKETQTEEK
jgi:hypothetical protein